MTNAVSRGKSKGQSVKSDILAPAGRHMTQPMRSTVSASRGSAYVPGIDFVEKWTAEYQSAQTTPATKPVDTGDPLAARVGTSGEDDALARKMQQLDDRNRLHRRKKRIALALVVAVITAIPALVIALLFFV